jgi:hypothetical protein
MGSSLNDRNIFMVPPTAFGACYGRVRRRREDILQQQPRVFTIRAEAIVLNVSEGEVTEIGPIRHQNFTLSPRYFRTLKPLCEELS